MYTDKESLEYFVALQNKILPTISIEVGAFDADFSVKIADRDISVYAFEASPHVFEKFKDRLSHINYINKAVMDYDGETQFNFTFEGNKENFILGHNSVKNGRWNIAESTIVQCTSLDSYFKDLHNEKIVMWIDCEGANKEVLLGAERLLSMTDSIYIEVEKTQLWKDIWVRDDVINYLEGLGFTLIKEYYAYPNQTNCIFIKNNLLNIVE